MKFCPLCSDPVEPNRIIFSKDPWATCDECTYHTTRQFLGVYEINDNKIRTGNYMFIPSLFWEDVTRTQKPPFVVFPLPQKIFETIANNYLEFIHDDDAFESQATF